MNIKERYYRWLAKRRLINRYGGYLKEVNKILEEYITDKLIQGGSSEFMEKGRQELINKQSEIKENDKFVDFLKKLR